MLRRIATALAAIVFMATTAFAKPVHNGYYWYVDPPYVGQERIFVGPYPNLAYCRDMLGSAIFSHPWACHLTGEPKDCVNTGTGFAYPAGWPYPFTPETTITGPDCVLKDRSTVKQPSSGIWRFLYYSPSESGIAACVSMKKIKTTIPDVRIGRYADMRCPGAPCFSIWNDTACN